MDKRLARKRALVLAAAAVFHLPAWSLDLAETYRLALEQDATIRASRAAAEAGRERLPQARSQFFPNISANSSRFKNELDSTTPDFLGRTVTNSEKYRSTNDALVVRQPLFRTELLAQYRQAEAIVADAEAVLERDQQNLVMRVAQTYFEALLTEQQLVLVGIQKAAYTTQVDAARKGFAAGAGTRTDIDEAQSRLDLIVAQELEARQNVELVRRQLQALINRPVTETVARIDLAKFQLAPPTPSSVEAWTAQAEAFSPEIQSAKAQVDAARAMVDKAKSGHYPTLDAVAQLSRSISDNVTRINTEYNQRQIGLQLNVPIFQGGYVNSQVREALALVTRAENVIEEVRRDLGVRVHREHRGVTEGVLKVQALEQAVRSAEQLALSSKRSFEAGVRTRLDILNAEQQLGTARRDLAQARFTYLVSRVRLKALAGGLKAENIDEINGWLQH
ncbi:TolC family outer membrane protein [uncultured Ramlibacter sp.]|uniref:TolC family outer membrane protein n=1 Tax=uncultured Ramlibacter sp. TaxID=260755 RepID=UPI00261ED47A|nr:TolC family outer membrane protein [uncultured Ramlibacter sp.]